MNAVAAAPRLLLVERDGDTRVILSQALREEGYQVTAIDSLAGALALLQAEIFDVILTDLFRVLPDPPFQAIIPLLHQAAPTPVVVITGWSITEAEARQAGFECLIKKPFDLDTLMAAVASCLHWPMTPEQEEQARTIKDYLAALEQHDIERLLNFCTEDVVYQAPAPTRWLPHTRPVRGKADFRAYMEQTYYLLPDLHLEQFVLFPHPTGIAARYTSSWLAQDGSRQRLTASLVFHFAGTLIRQFGVRSGNEILAERQALRLD